MPSRADLMDRFGTTAVTITKALSHLKREGFIESRGREGTFVSHAPPHLFRYGLVLPDFPEGNGSLTFRFASMLSKVAEASSGQRPRRLAVYSNVRGESEGEEDTLRLRSDLEHRCLAGMIFTERYTLANPAIARMIEQSNLPKVAILNNPDGRGVVPLRMEPFWARAARYFASRGRKRVGFCFLDFDAESRWPQACDAMSNEGLATRLWWRIDVNGRCVSGVRPVIQMMLQLPVAQRPDALLICDDSLVPGVTAALVEAGAADAFDVIAHANFPFVTPSAVPAARLGYDAAEVLRTCVDTIDQLRSGNLAASRIVPCRWEAAMPEALIPSFLNTDSHLPSSHPNQQRRKGQPCE